MVPKLGRLGIEVTCIRCVIPRCNAARAVRFSVPSGSSCLRAGLAPTRSEQSACVEQKDGSAAMVATAAGKLAARRIMHTGPAQRPPCFASGARRQAAAAVCARSSIVMRPAPRPVAVAAVAEAESAAPQPKRKTLKGKVVSCKLDKTVVVQVVRVFPHPKYGKRMKMSKNFYAHDEENQYGEGDLVVVEASRPMSKLKRWTVKELIQKA